MSGESRLNHVIEYGNENTLGMELLHEGTKLKRPLINQTTSKDIAVVQISNFPISRNESINEDADENDNLRRARIKETSKLLRSIANPGQTNLPYTTTRCGYYDMEPRDKQFLSRLVVVVSSFIILILTIMIIFYIWTGNRSN